MYLSGHKFESFPAQTPGRLCPIQSGSVNKHRLLTCLQKIVTAIRIIKPSTADISYLKIRFATFLMVCLNCLFPLVLDVLLVVAENDISTADIRMAKSQLCRLASKQQQFPNPCQQHKEFPFQFYFGPICLNFGVWMRACVSACMDCVCDEAKRLKFASRLIQSVKTPNSRDTKARVLLSIYQKRYLCTRSSYFSVDCCNWD